MKRVTRLRLLIILPFCAMFTFSCVKLTKENQDKITVNNQRAVKISDHLKKLYKSLRTVEEKLADLYAKWRAGEITKEDRDSVEIILKQEKDVIEITIKAGVEEYKAIAKDTKVIIDSGVPMWQVILLTVLGVGGAVAERHFKLKGARKVGATAITAFGAVSRAFDKLSGSPEHKSAIINAEIINAPGLTEDVMRPLHDKAKAREI